MKVQKSDELTIGSEWVVLKTANGFCECYMNTDIQKNGLTILNQSNGMCIIYVYKRFDYPVKFRSNPTITVNSINVGDYQFCAPYGIIRDITSIIQLGFIRVGAFTGDFLPITIRVKGLLA